VRVTRVVVVRCGRGGLPSLIHSADRISQVLFAPWQPQ
jgi:hypothetical protein